MLALVLVAVSLGLSNFAAAVGIGVSGTGARTRPRVGVIFGLFETGMPILGLVLGRSLPGQPRGERLPMRLAGHAGRPRLPS